MAESDTPGDNTTLTLDGLLGALADVYGLPISTRWQHRQSAYVTPGMVIVMDLDASPVPRFLPRRAEDPRYWILSNEPLTLEQQAAALRVFLARGAGELTIDVDPTVPPGELHARDVHGRTVGKIVGLEADA
ncbi:MAG: hypothetical protein ACREBE_13775 [bacterium]